MQLINSDSWCDYFMKMAILASTRSKDRSTKVGAVAVDEQRNVVATGYNGFARNIRDDIERRHDRPEKYLWTCHAEENVILSAARRGVRLEGCTLFCTHPPCARCARGLIQVGITAVMFPELATITTMIDDLNIGMSMMYEADLTIRHWQGDVDAKSIIE